MSEEFDTPQISAEDRASQMGWVPQDKWRGSPDHWVEADEFLRRGEQIMPILRKNNEHLSEKVSRLENEVSRVTQMLNNARESMEAMKELQVNEVKRQVEVTRKELLSGIRNAKEAGDIDAEMALQEQLVEVVAQKKALDETPKEETKQQQPAAPQPDPATQSWLDQNTWFNKDKRKTALAVQIANELAEQGRRPSESYYADLDAELEKFFPNPNRDAPGKVEGGRTATRSTSSSSKSYNALPRDAKEQADKDYNPKLVGEGRMFANKAEFQDHWAKLYFAAEE